MNVKTFTRFSFPAFLLCMLSCFTLISSYAQGPAGAGRVSGKVVDENGNGVANVTVTVQGTQVATKTDESGNYTIQAPSNGTLLFTSVGYGNSQLAVSGRSTVNATMTTQSSNLNEVVVVGYGTQRKVDLTGSVASVTRKDFVNKPFTSPDQILGGRVPGVNITNRSGDPGAPIDVRIRGVGTTGTNQPLWVIDGVPIVQTTNMTVNTSSTTESNPLAGINTNDIESIDVLKDASASAIYGARAANGVIIVTTRRGKEGRTSLTYDGFYGVQYVPQGKRFDVLNVDEYLALQSELGRNLSQFKGQPYVDWQDAIFQQGPVNSHNLTISGGSQKATFNIGAGYLDNTGVELAQHFKRLSLKVNSDVSVGKYLKFGESMLVSAVDRLTQSESGLFAAYSAAQNAPYY